MGERRGREEGERRGGGGVAGGDERGWRERKVGGYRGTGLSKYFALGIVLRPAGTLPCHSSVPFTRSVLVFPE